MHIADNTAANAYRREVDAQTNDVEHVDALLLTETRRILVEWLGVAGHDIGSTQPPSCSLQRVGITSIAVIKNRRF